MKNSALFLSIIVNAVLLIFIAFWPNKEVFVLSKKRPSFAIHAGDNLQSLKKDNFSVAIVIPTSHYSMQEIIQGFERRLDQLTKTSVDYSIFNGNGSRTLLKAQLEDIARKEFDIVLSIGTTATQLAKEVFVKRKSNNPLVFAAVADPVGLGLISSLFEAAPAITGSVATTDFVSQIELICALKPKVSRMLLVYDPGQPAGSCCNIAQIDRECMRKRIHLDKIEVDSLADLQRKLPLAVSKEYDTLMILKDNTVVPAIDLIVKLAEKFGMTVYASDLNSVERGAAVGFGVHEECFGQDAAECAYKILATEERPAKVPVKITDKFRLGLNRVTLQRQDIEVDERFNKLINLVEFIG